MTTPQSTAIATPPEHLAIYIRKPEVVEKFALVLGNNREAMRFVQSVILAVETAEPGEYSLLNCSNMSIVRSALRAATQRVSVDPLDRQAFLIPRNNRKTGKQEASLQLHYSEVYNRAMRSNRYSIINVSPVFEGSEVFEDMYTGMHVVQIENGLMTTGHEQVSRLRRVSDKSKERIGWLGYYRTTRGQEKTIYMTMKEIEKNASTNTGWQKSFGWTKYRDIMEMKTVLLALLRKADLSAPGMEEVKNALAEVDAVENGDNGPDLAGLETHDAGYVDGETKDAEPQPVTISSEEEAYIQAGEVETSFGKALKDMDDEKLTALLQAENQELVKAATIRLEWHKIHPNPVKPKKTEQQQLKELGFN